MEKRKELTGRPAAIETLETRATREAYNAVVGARLRQAHAGGDGGRARRESFSSSMSEEDNTVEFPTSGARVA